MGAPERTRSSPGQPASTPALVRRLRSATALLVKRSTLGLRALRALRIVSEPGEYLARLRLGQQQLAAHPSRLRIDPVLGYRRIEAAELPLLREFVELSRELRAARAQVLEHMHHARAGKHRIVFDILSDARIAADPRWLAFALCEELLSAASDYLGELPVLSRIGVGVSMPSASNAPPVHSQLFHVDAEDLRQLKLMVNTSHVRNDDGPFSWLSAAESARVRRRLGQGVLARLAAQQRDGATTTPRYWDGEVFTVAPQHALEQLVGPPGTAVLIDTARCLHFGSRLRASRERVLSAVLFERYHRGLDSPINVFERQPFERDRVRWSVLDAPRRHATGTFYPEPDDGALGPAHAIALPSEPPRASSPAPRA